MAQLSGVMTADFSDFMFEIDKSVVKLLEFQRARRRHESESLDGFSDGLRHGGSDACQPWGSALGRRFRRSDELRERGGEIRRGNRAPDWLGRLRRPAWPRIRRRATSSDVDQALVRPRQD